MKFLVLSVVIAAAFAAPRENVEIEEANVEVEEAQMPFFNPMFGGFPNMFQQQNHNSHQQYPIDYSQACSNNCNCGMICVPWNPCGCQCPPPCPPATTTTAATTTTTTTTRATTPAPLCSNGAPDSAFPYCCTNGARNQYCCLNGANNPDCTPPVQNTPAPPPPGGDCNGGGCCQPCRCQPCMIWWMCSPCNCNNGCETTTTSPQPQPPTSAPPLCDNGAPDSAFPDCCFNGGRGQFCCQNGATNLHCCLNGANNPQCSLPTQPPVQGPPSTPPGGCNPNPCQCPICVPWFPCSPCSCNNSNPCSGGRGSNSPVHVEEVVEKDVEENVEDDFIPY